MKPAFQEAYLANDQDPVDGQVADFDWPGLDRLLGECEADNSERDWIAMGEALARILDWLTAVNLDSPNAERFAGRRAFALAWVVNPAKFDGSPSLTKLAQRLGLGPRLLQHAAAAATEEFGIVNRGQAHAWNRKPKENPKE